MSRQSESDRRSVDAMVNFLTWGERPRTGAIPVMAGPFKWPPAVFAYVMGLTRYCPPKGTM